MAKFGGRGCVLALWCLVWSGHSAAQEQNGWTPSMRAAESPTQKPWEEGATLAFKSVDGQSSEVADAVLTFERLVYTKTDKGFSRTSFGPGVYLHRNTDAAKPTNDRGVMFTGGGLWINNWPADGSRIFWGWSVDAKVGKKLMTEMRAGQPVLFDKTSSRIAATGQHVWAPAVRELLDPDNLRPDAYWFTTTTVRLYADRVSGGSGTSGRISGTEFGIRVDYAPFGLNPAMAKIGGTGLGVVPSLAIWAQQQSDFSASGGRKKDSRSLYGVKLQFSFAQLDGAGAVPAVVLERSIGEDVLTGRADSGITKLALSLKF